MIKKLIEKISSTNNTYQRDPPSIEDLGFYKYLNKEVKFYSTMAEHAGKKPMNYRYCAQKKNDLEKDL